MFWAAFPDGELFVEDVVAEGDRVAWRWTHRGTHRGEFMGIAGTGRSVTWTGITIWRVADGRISDWWAVPDILGLLRQLATLKIEQ
jgi:predicted ester cyclase